MKHSIFVYIHLNLTLNSTHTHPLNYYKVEQSIMLGGFIYKFPKQKKNEKGLLLRIAYLVPIFACL